MLARVTSVFSHSTLPAFVVCFLEDTLLTGIRYNLNVILNCMSLMGNDVNITAMSLSVGIGQNRCWEAALRLSA